MDKISDSGEIRWRMYSPSQQLIAEFARTPIGVVQFGREHFPSGFESRDEVLMTNRFILVLSGQLSYEVEGETTQVTPGVQCFVPSWVRRHWVSAEGCELIWCDFATEHLWALPSELYIGKPRSFALEQSTFERLYADWPEAVRRFPYELSGETLGGSSDAERALGLRYEGEIKALLARFWTVAKCCSSENDTRVTCLHPEVKRAAEWIACHYREPDAIERFYASSDLSADHFRRLFRRAFGESLQARLTRTRLRYARFWVCETSRSIKEIAYDAGYEDPLYFSRQFRAYWGQSPMRFRS